MSPLARVSSGSRSRLKRVGIVLLALVGVYAAAGFLLAPWIFQRHVPPLIQQKLERQVSVDDVAFNPFLLQFELRGLVVEGPHGRPAISVARLFADLGFVGLLRRTWTVALIEHVYADAQRRGASPVHWLTHESNLQARQLYDRIAHRPGFIQYRRNLA